MFESKLPQEKKSRYENILNIKRKQASNIIIVLFSKYSTRKISLQPQNTIYTKNTIHTKNKLTIPNYSTHKTSLQSQNTIYTKKAYNPKILYIRKISLQYQNPIDIKNKFTISKYHIYTKNKLKNPKNLKY